MCFFARSSAWWVRVLQRKIYFLLFSYFFCRIRYFEMFLILKLKIERHVNLFKNCFNHIFNILATIECKLTNCKSCSLFSYRKLILSWIYFLKCPSKSRNVFKIFVGFFEIIHKNSIFLQRKWKEQFSKKLSRKSHYKISS